MGVKAHPWTSCQLIDWPSISPQGFGTLPQGYLSSAVKVSPWYQHTFQIVCVTGARTRNPPLLQPNTQSELLPQLRWILTMVKLAFSSVFHDILYAHTWILVPGRGVSSWLGLLLCRCPCNCHILSPYCLLFSGGASFIRVNAELQLESDVNVQLMHLYHCGGLWTIMSGLMGDSFRTRMTFLG